MLRELVKTARPHQWIKNAFVVVPLVYSQTLTDTGRVGRSLIALLLFCLASSAIYMINDILDRRQDRAHPTKRNRPIASGQLPVRVAVVAAAVLIVVALGSALCLGGAFALVLGAYWVMNLAYSLRLKHVVYLDVTIIGAGFLLRILAGALAIDVPISAWLIICTFLLALFLAMGKRRHELAVMGDGTATRKVLERYRVESLDLSMGLAAALTVVCYTIYTFSASTRLEFDTAMLPLGIPFIMYGLFRFYVLTHRADNSTSPTEALVKDPLFVGNLLVWGVLNLALIYG